MSGRAPMPAPSDRLSQLSLSSTRRTFTLKSIIKRDDRGKEDDGEAGKGPIGLTTLYEPEGPSIVDLVFVHGLNGGSVSTWTRNGDKSLFWPKEWLPNDHAFSDARIHTFGYDSSWSHESILNIHDFATALLVSIKHAPSNHSRDEGVPTPLVLIGHSMGGLVIKRAYIVAKHRAEFAGVSDRVFSVFFLATPHGGSDMAALLTKLLSLSPDRPFVRELHRNSPTLQAINEEFPRYSQDLKLFSFFETQPMNYGVGKGLIVEKECAVMNISNETSSYLHANHRDVAKYTSQSDPSYITVRNALAAMIDQLRDNQNSTRERIADEQREALDAFLGVSDAPEAILSGVRSSRFDGSCEWFLQKDSFSRWRDGPCSQILWVQGKPGMGKSVLAGRVIDEMRHGLGGGMPKHCSFYFFSHSERSRCTAAVFLLTMAWQMAVLHPEILQVISRAAKLWKDSRLSMTDHSPVWRRIFVDRILKVKLNKTQYWIIDGFDECSQQSELLSMLLTIQQMWPLSILVTSRNSFSATCTSLLPDANVVSVSLGEDDSRQDIDQFVDSHIRLVPSQDEATRNEMAREIKEKSMGCFLWVRVVLAQLQKVHSTTAAQRVLESVPPDMDELYRRILKSMLEEQLDRRFAKAILKWAVCSSRPLTAEELHTALEVDLDDTIPDVEKAVEAYCGQLVYFDAQKKMRLLHLTTRAVLTNPATDSEFVVNKGESHTSIALVCLKHLSGLAVKHPRSSRRLGSDRENNPSQSPFTHYACMALFEHVARSKNYGAELYQPLAAFLNSPNVLSWIEHLARHSELTRLLQAGRSLTRLLKQGNVAQIAGLSPNIQVLATWATDLVRLVSKFGRQLTSHPHAIHTLIPPFCPQGSALHKRFASPRGLHLVGAAQPNWDDCSSVITYAKGETITVAACCERFFALGTLVGREIVIYDELTCQERGRLNNKEPVVLLRFGSTCRYLASAGHKSIKIWDLEKSEMVSNIPCTSRCMSIEFTEDDNMMLVALKNNHFVFWDVVNDELADEDRWSVDPRVQETYDFRSPTMSAIGVHQNLVAVSYRSQDLLVWNFETFTLHDVYYRETGSRGWDESTTSAPKQKSTVLSLTFGAAPNSNALLVCYFDGELVLYDTFDGTVRHRVSGVNAHCLVSSPDGRTLATGDATGTIRLFDLETLRFLYRINFHAEFLGVRALSITADGRRLLDVRGKQCRVWEPLALLRQEVVDDANSDALSTVSTNPQEEVDFEGPMNINYITATALIRGGEYVLVGKDDGTVSVYDSARGDLRQVLFDHGVTISFLEYDGKTGIIVCADQASRVVCYRLVTRPGLAPWEVDSVFEVQIRSAITQLLTSTVPGLSRLLVCTAGECFLYDVGSGSSPLSAAVANITWSTDRHRFSWAQHPTLPDQLLLVLNGRVHIFLWESLRLVSHGEVDAVPTEQMLLGEDVGVVMPALMPSAEVVKARILSGSPFFVTTCEDTRLNTQDRTEVLLWDGAILSNTDTGSGSSIQPAAFSASLSTKVDHIIGTFGGDLVFLHVDGWVCTIPLNAAEKDIKVTQHFFVPPDWISLNSHLIVTVTVGGDIIFAQRSELIIIKRGLEIERPSLASASRRSASSTSGMGTPRGSSRPRGPMGGRSRSGSGLGSSSGMGSRSRHGSLAVGNSSRYGSLAGLESARRLSES
ncbi:NACHT and WD domain-protein [Podospora australis]|uniref:GPI inositol-deacylase n=1 Tax=Podospora australis TaxID=1536484 RepID=A0AAN7AEA2_9PEZI|nr:NACHT and WD domain-protein [Podospora australis]